MTGAVERALGIGTVSIHMAVMGIVAVMSCKGVDIALVDI